MSTIKYFYNYADLILKIFAIQKLNALKINLLCGVQFFLVEYYL